MCSISVGFASLWDAEAEIYGSACPESALVCIPSLQVDTMSIKSETLTAGDNGSRIEE